MGEISKKMNHELQLKRIIELQNKQDHYMHIRCKCVRCNQDYTINKKVHDEEFITAFQLSYCNECQMKMGVAQ